MLQLLDKLVTVTHDTGMLGLLSLVLNAKIKNAIDCGNAILTSILLQYFNRRQTGTALTHPTVRELLSAYDYQFTIQRMGEHGTGHQAPYQELDQDTTC